MSGNSGENSYIRWMRERTPADPRVPIGPGDDAALLQIQAAGQALVTTDMLMDGTDFHLSEAGPFRVGRKAMAVNLSDIAAMAGRPVAAFVSVALPRNGGQAIATELYRGLRSMADEFDTALAGGDTNSWDGPLVISVTVVGEPTGRGPVRRSGAKPGDWLFVTGPLGGSILGKHLDFTPRVREAQCLHELVDLHAMMDISDGLAVDLAKLCEESRCGAVLNAESIPISDDAGRVGDEKSALDHALSDGEDFELLFAVEPDQGPRLLVEQPVGGVALSHIGECEQSGLWIDRTGSRRPLTPSGYVHAFD